MSVFANIKPPKVIYKTESDYNGVIEVLENAKGNRKIRVGGFTQSVCVNTQTGRKRVWGRVVEILKEEMPNLRNILILGLGGGTMQRIISEDLPKASMVSVEIDTEMVDVARRFFDIESIPNHRIIVADACLVIVEPQKFDLAEHFFDAVIVDVFAGAEYPDLGDSGNFLAAIKRMLVPGGLAIFNRIYLERYQEDADVFADLLENFFSDINSRTVAGHTNSDNILIYGKA